MANDLKHRNILYDDRQIGLYPTDKLKRVDKPTTKYVLDPDLRVRRKESDHVMMQAATGAYGEDYKDLSARLTVQEPLGAAFISMQHCISGVRINKVASKKAPIPDNPRVLSRHIKSLAIFLGADMVGICKLPQSSVYTRNVRGEPISAPYDYAIVFIVRKHVPTMTASDGCESVVDPISFQAYQRLACQAQTMANYIRRLGHDAMATHMFSYLTMMPQLILEAGLGEMSRMGLVVNPFIGANFKSAAVLTNMPLEVDKPVDFGLQDYCENCNVCVKACPEGAVPSGDKIIYNGYETWIIDREKCIKQALKTRICGRCTKMCPWSNVDVRPEAFSNWDGNVEWLHERAKQRTRDIISQDWHASCEQTDKWWFDLVKHDMNSDELFIADEGELIHNE